MTWISCYTVDQILNEQTKLKKIIGFLITFIFIDVEMKAIGVKSVLDFPTKQGMVLTMVVEDMEVMALLVVVEVVQVVVEVDL